jgi:hypothetical protein
MDGWLDAADRQLARSIFGIDDRSGVEWMILDWIALQGLGNGTFKSIEICVGAAITVALADKSPIFVKAWPGSIERASLSAQLGITSTFFAFLSPLSLSRKVANEIRRLAHDHLALSGTQAPPQRHR